MTDKNREDIAYIGLIVAIVFLMIILFPDKLICIIEFQWSTLYPIMKEFIMENIRTILEIGVIMGACIFIYCFSKRKKKFKLSITSLIIITSLIWGVALYTIIGTEESSMFRFIEIIGIIAIPFLLYSMDNNRKILENKEEDERKDKALVDTEIRNLIDNKRPDELLTVLYEVEPYLTKNSSYREVFLKSIKTMEVFARYAETKDNLSTFYNNSIYKDILTFIRNKDSAGAENLRKKIGSTITEES